MFTLSHVLSGQSLSVSEWVRELLIQKMCWMVLNRTRFLDKITESHVEGTVHGSLEKNIFVVFDILFMDLWRKKRHLGSAGGEIEGHMYMPPLVMVVSY